MNEKTLRITVGPVILSQNGSGYSANWHDPQLGNICHPIDAKWNPWIESHFSHGILAGFGFAFILPEMVKGCPQWDAKVNEISRAHCESL